MHVPEFDDVAPLELFLGERQIVRERTVELEGDKHQHPKDEKTCSSCVLGALPPADCLYFHIHNAKQQEAEEEGEEVVVQVHHSGQPGDGDHVRCVETEESEKKITVLQAEPERMEEGCENQGGPHDNSNEAGKPSNGIRDEVQVCVAAVVRRLPAVVDRAAAERPEEERAPVLAWFAEIQFRYSS